MLRLLLSSLLLLSLCPVPSASARATRVLLLGDSNFFGALGHQFARELRSRGFEVKLKARSGSGLAFPRFHDWETLAPELAEKYEADVVVMMFGGNDAQSLKPARSESFASRIPWRDDPRWRQTYRERIRRMARRITDNGRRFILMSPTNRRPRKMRERLRRVLEEQQAAIEDVPAAVWVDTWTPSSEEDGLYRAYGRDQRGRRVRFRHGDGIHLTREGARDLAARMLPKLLAQLDRPEEIDHASIR